MDDDHDVEVDIIHLDGSDDDDGENAGYAASSTDADDHRDDTFVDSDTASQPASSVPKLGRPSKRHAKSPAPARTSKKRAHETASSPLAEIALGAPNQRTRRKELKPLLQRILKSAYKKDPYALFSAPVDVRQMPHYREVIATPIDLSVIKFRVERNMYTSIEDFQRDFDLMVTNCNTFNMPGSLPAREIQKMSALVYSWLERESSNQFYIDAKKSDLDSCYRPGLKGPGPKWRDPKDPDAADRRTATNLLDLSGSAVIDDTAQLYTLPQLTDYGASETTSRKAGKKAQHDRETRPATHHDFEIFATTQSNQPSPVYDDPLLPLIYGDESGYAYVSSMASFTRDMPASVLEHVYRKSATLTKDGIDVHLQSMIEAPRVQKQP
ncbi:hypothetical protein RI367_002749 [Sorochytrium milnesiophthora]